VYGYDVSVSINNLHGTYFDLILPYVAVRKCSTNLGSGDPALGAIFVRGHGARYEQGQSVACPVYDIPWLVFYTSLIVT
jgi:hypothetical protein